MNKKISGFIIVLGSPNDHQGSLSAMGEGRVNAGYDAYVRLCGDGYRLLLTGGFGEHFNTTDKPNAYYAQQMLLKLGVPPEHIVEFAESRNTVDDALQARPIVDRYGASNLLVISSDFHMERVRFVFEKVFPEKKLNFEGVSYLGTRSAEERERLLTHEARELQSLRERGESIVGGVLKVDSWKRPPRGIEV